MNIIYCRGVIDGQAGIHVEACKRYAKKEGINIDAVYIDDGFAAGKGFELPKVLKLIKNGNVKTIVSTDCDRFFRDPVEMKNFTTELSRQGVELCIIDKL